MDVIENIHSSLLFVPTRQVFGSPASEGIEYEDIHIETDDRETLHGYHLPHEEKTNKTIIYLHGNGDNVTIWYQSCVTIQKHVQVNALVVDYRGYGKSTGSPSRHGVVTDSLAMYKYLIDKGLKPEDISIYGMSIGGAIGLELAKRKRVKGVVIQSSFTSLKDIAKDVYPLIPRVIIRNDLLNSIQNIKQINAPILISHGSIDEVVPVEHAYKLFEAANEPKKLIILKGAMHNDISSFFNEEYFSELRRLFT